VHALELQRESLGCNFQEDLQELVSAFYKSAETGHEIPLRLLSALDICSTSYSAKSLSCANEYFLVEKKRG